MSGFVEIFRKALFIKRRMNMAEEAGQGVE
jgi:hypothetical protein